MRGVAVTAVCLERKTVHLATGPPGANQASKKTPPHSRAALLVVVNMPWVICEDSVGSIEQQGSLAGG